MSLTREAIQEIKAGAEAQVITLEDGKRFICKGNTVEEIYPYYQETLKLSTLEGLVDYINKEVDKYEHNNELTIVVDSQREISVYKKLNDRLDRGEVLKVEAITPRIRYGNPMDSEEFIVNLLSNFLETDNRNKVIDIVSNMSDEEEAKVTDDGISQKVVLKKGVRKEEGSIQNPVMLRPICTFTEVEQPERPFILRIRNVNNMCLHEGNDTIWINKAKNNIKWYLEENIKADSVKIIL